MAQRADRASRLQIEYDNELDMGSESWTDLDSVKEKEETTAGFTEDFTFVPVKSYENVKIPQKIRRDTSISQQENKIKHYNQLRDDLLAKYRDDKSEDYGTKHLKVGTLEGLKRLDVQTDSDGYSEIISRTPIEDDERSSKTSNLQFDFNVFKDETEDIDEDLELWLADLRSEIEKKPLDETLNIMDPKTLLNNVIAEKRMETISREAANVGKFSVLAVSTGGKVIAVATISGLIVVFNSNEEVLCGLGSSSDAAITSMDLAIEHNMLAVGYENGSALIWNYEQACLIARLDAIHDEADLQQAETIRQKIINNEFDESEPRIVGKSPITNIKFVTNYLLVATDADGVALLNFGQGILQSKPTLTYRRLKNINVPNVIDVLVIPNSHVLLLTYDILYVLDPFTELVNMVADRPGRDILAEAQPRKRLISLHDPIRQMYTSNPNDTNRSKLYTLQYLKSKHLTPLYDQPPCMSPLIYQNKEEHRATDDKYSIMLCWGREIYLYYDVLGNNWSTNGQLELALEYDIVCAGWVAPNVLTLIDTRHKLLVVDPSGRPEIVQIYNLPSPVPNSLYAVTGTLSAKSDPIYIAIPDYRKSIVAGNTLIYNLGEISLLNLRILTWTERIDIMISIGRWEDAFNMAFQFRDDQQKAAVGLPADKALRYRITSERIEGEIPHYLQNILSSHIMRKSAASVREEKIRNAGIVCMKYALQVCFGFADEEQEKELATTNRLRAERLIFSRIFDIYHDNGREDTFYRLVLEFIKDRKLSFIRDAFLGQFVEFHLQTTRGKANKLALLVNLDDCLTMLDLSNVVTSTREHTQFSEKGLTSAGLYSTSVHAANYRSINKPSVSNKSFYITNLQKLLQVPPVKLHGLRRSDILLKFITKYLVSDVPYFDVDKYILRKQTLKLIFEDDLAIFKLCTKQFEKSVILNQVDPTHTFYTELPHIVDACYELDLDDLQKIVFLPIFSYASRFMSRELERQNPKFVIPDEYKSPKEYAEYVRDKTTALYIAVFLAKMLIVEKEYPPTDLFITENEESEEDRNAYDKRKRVITELRASFESLMVIIDKFLSKYYDPLISGEYKTRPDKLDPEAYRNLLLDNVVVFIYYTLIDHARSKVEGARDPNIHVLITRDIVQKLINDIVFRYKYSNMSAILKNIHRMIVGDNEDEPLFEVAKHMYANIGSLPDDPPSALRSERPNMRKGQERTNSVLRTRMRDWYLGVIYPKYVKAVGTVSYDTSPNAAKSDTLVVNKEAIKNLMDPFIASLNHDQERDREGNVLFPAHENVILWMQDTMHNTNADKTHKLFMFEYIEAELKHYGSGPEGLMHFCRAKDVPYDEFFNFYLNLYCSFQEHYLIKAFLEKHAKKIKSSNDTFEMVMRLCKNIPEAKAFLLEMRGDIIAALREIIKEMTTHLSRLQSLVISNSEQKCNEMSGQPEQINQNYMHRIVDGKLRAIDKVVEDFDLVTEDKFVFVPDRAYVDQEAERQKFLQVKKLVRLPPISLHKRLLSLIQSTMKDWPTIGETVSKLRRENTFVHESQLAEKTRQNKTYYLLAGVKNQPGPEEDKAVVLQSILALMKMPTVPRSVVKANMWDGDLSNMLSETSRKFTKDIKSTDIGSANTLSDEIDIQDKILENENEWASLCRQIVELEEQDVIETVEFKDLLTTVDNAIFLCRTNSERNTLEDSQVQILWFMLLDQFLRFMHELRNKALRLANPTRNAVQLKKETTQVDETEKKKQEREKQAKELDNLLADSDSDSDDNEDEGKPGIQRPSDEEYDPEDLSIYDTQIAGVDKDILDCQKDLASLTRDIDKVKKQLNQTEKSKTPISPTSEKKDDSKKKKEEEVAKTPVVIFTDQQQLVDTITKLETRITQKRQYIDYLRRRKDELEEEKSHRQHEIARKNEQLEKMNVLANFWMQRCLAVLLGNIISSMMKYVDIPFILNKITKDQRKKVNDASNNQFHRIRTTVMRILSNYRYERMLLKTQSDLLSSDTYNRGSYFLALRQKGIPLPCEGVCVICGDHLGGALVREAAAEEENKVEASLDFDVNVFQCEHNFHKKCCQEEHIRVCPICNNDDERNIKSESGAISEHDTGKKEKEEERDSEILRIQEEKERQKKLIEERIEQENKENELKAKGRETWSNIDPKLERYDGLGTLDRLLVQQKKKEEFEAQRLALEREVNKQEEQKKGSPFVDRIEVTIRNLKSKIEEITIEFQNNMIMLNNSGRLQSVAGLHLANAMEIELDKKKNREDAKRALLLQQNKPVDNIRRLKFEKAENVVDLFTNEDAW
jgi:hypothetical protein